MENATVSAWTTTKLAIPYLRAIWEETVFGVLVEMGEAKVKDDLVEDLFAVGGTQHGQTLDAGRPLEHFSPTGPSQASLSPLASPSMSVVPAAQWPGPGSSRAGVLQ